MSVISYKIIRSFYFDTLGEEVSKLRARGWECQGSLAVVASGGQFLYAQAMVTSCGELQK